MPDSGHSIAELRDVIRSCPAIDNHAHNILIPSHESSYSLLSATTEASGDALEDTPRSLPHLRMVRQLRELYGCDQTAGWDQLMDRRRELLTADAPDLFRKCFQNIHTVLMDDGLDKETVHTYDWHDQFLPGKTSRIVRIETVAADILRDMHHSGHLQIEAAFDDEDYCGSLWISFLGAFESAIASCIRDDEVAGFKSVICYRTGLDVVVGPDVEIATSGLDAFRDNYLNTCIERDFRIESKGLNDCILISTCRLLTAGYQQSELAKPLQFHTGLGDRDISLLRSDPAHLQPLIEKFPDVQFILLHSSYPYTRQAGYLATVFENVFLDLGEVFPMVSRDGQEHIIRQAFELTPISKLLYSTDAHHWAEVYWLADKQFREALEKVLIDYVDNNDLTVSQAVEAARDVFFNNSNRIYHLGLNLPELRKTPLQLAWKDKSTIAPLEHEEAPQSLPIYDKSLLKSFKNMHRYVQFVYVQWLDYMATVRTRILPYREFANLVEEERRIAIARGNTGTLQNDGITAAVNPQGQIFVEPDLTTLSPTHSKDPLRSASVIASFRDEDGKPLPACPRASLERLVDQFEIIHEIDFQAGFEIELVLLHQSSDKNKPYGYDASDTNHAWSTLTPEQHMTTIPILAEIVTELSNMGIFIQQFHSESGPGQYELVLPPLSIVNAIDTLVRARQVVYQIAHSHNLRATLHPTPLNGAGSGQHVHISLNSDSLSPSELEEREMSFFASVLEHLPAICAFSLPNEASYERVKDDIWTGGTWCCWGTQNREVPLRRVKAGRWEIRCLDGLANPYLALGAILGAGFLGLKSGTEMQVQDCRDNPARLSEVKRKEMGIVTKLPMELDEALKALESDGGLEEVLSPGLAKDYLVMKRAEKEMLNKMPKNARKAWLIERY